ncbi:MAG: prefoldin subunit alpha [Nanoarchaeota archaeon]
MKEEVQKKYLEFQLIQQQLEQLQQQHLLAQTQVTQLRVVKDALEEVQKTPLKNEVLAPLGAGVFVKTTLQENAKVLMNVGAKTAVSKPIGEARGIVEKQMTEVTAFEQDLQKAMMQFVARSQELQREMQKEADGE